jgi:HPt (histidine-containing phosphotransfer) domain-containing protein
MATSTALLNGSESSPFAARLLDCEPPRACAIDLVHLSRQTLGDRFLETELLRLFAHQCAQILEKLERTGGDHSSARDLAHMLKGSARAIGAHSVSEVAELYERDAGEHGLQADVLLPRLRAATLEALQQVQKLLGEN